jgi:cation diffusion facilitator family transporter
MADDRQEAQALARRTAVVSIIVRTVLVALKYAFAVLSGSLALMADAVHNVTDIAQSVALYLGLRISGRKSSDFPYGLYKLENLISLGIALIIAFVGYELARHALLREPPEEIRNLPATIAAVIAAMAISYGFSRYEAGIARRTGSPALEADSRDALIDTLKTSTVLLSFIAAHYGYIVDTWMALAIVLFIIWTAAQLGISSIRVLLDASIEPELLGRIREVLEYDPEVVEVHDLTGRNSGAYRFIEAHVVLDVPDLERAHEASYRLEEAVQKLAPNIDRVLIHLEPEERDEYLYAVPMDDDETLSPTFGDAPRFALVIVGSEDGHVRDLQYVENPFIDEPDGRGIRVALMLVHEGVDTVLSHQDIERKAPWYVLTAERVAVVHTAAETLRAALAEASIVHQDHAQQ